MTKQHDTFFHVFRRVGNPVCPAREHPLPNGPGSPVAARELQGLFRQTHGREGCRTFQQNPSGHWQKIFRGKKHARALLECFPSNNTTTQATEVMEKFYLLFF